LSIDLKNLATGVGRLDQKRALIKVNREPISINPLKLINAEISPKIRNGLSKAASRGYKREKNPSKTKSHGSA
jgi:hypothetical protein